MKKQPKKRNGVIEMARPSAKKNVNIFAERLGQLIRERNCIHEDVASAVGVTRQGVGKWVSGDSIPDVLTTAKVAKFFGVSVDYLAGASDVRSTNTDLKAVCDYTGLSESNIKLFSELNKVKKLSKKIQQLKKQLNEPDNDKEVNYPYTIDIISTMIDVLDSYDEMIGNIKHAAVIDINEGNEEEIMDELSDIDNERKNDQKQPLMDMIYGNGTVLTGYYYKRFLFQSVIDEGRHYFQEVIQKLTPPENLYEDEDGNIVDVSLDTRHAEDGFVSLYDDACCTTGGYYNGLIVYMYALIEKKMKNGEKLNERERKWLEHFNNDNASMTDLIREWEENIDGINTTKKE